MIKAIPMEDWLRGCIYHDGRHGYVTLPIDKVHQIANYIQRTRRITTDGLIDLEVVETDRKTENCSEFPNNCEPQTETSTNNSTISEKIQLTKCDLCRREGDDVCVDCERKKRSGKE